MISELERRRADEPGALLICRRGSCARLPFRFGAVRSVAANSMLGADTRARSGSTTIVERGG